jgi:anti-sigma factor RsiW
MARIIPFRHDEHHETQLLLPWYATGGLSPDEQARVEAHLAACPDCASELNLERELAAELKALPLDTDHGWSRFRARLEEPRRAKGVSAARRRASPWAWGAMAASVCVAAALAVSGYRSLEAPQYRTLSARAQPSAGSLIVIFRPDASETDLRRALMAAQVRIVDGPTAAGAFVLRAPSAGEAAALRRLRGDKAVVLAEPLDPRQGGS